MEEVFRALGGLPRHGVALLRSAAIGCWMGYAGADALPHELGIAKRFSPMAALGTGEPEGIIAPKRRSRRRTSGCCDALARHSAPTAAVMMAD